jgi:hypothetical protein
LAIVNYAAIRATFDKIFHALFGKRAAAHQ